MFVLLCNFYFIIQFFINGIHFHNINILPVASFTFIQSFVSWLLHEYLAFHSRQWYRCGQTTWCVGHTTILEIDINSVSHEEHILPQEVNQLNKNIILFVNETKS
jgi:hypothetical protein